MKYNLYIIYIYLRFIKQDVFKSKILYNFPYRFLNGRIDNMDVYTTSRKHVMLNCGVGIYMFIFRTSLYIYIETPVNHAIYVKCRCGICAILYAHRRRKWEPVKFPYTSKRQRAFDSIYRAYTQYLEII